jgi:hypothetical protein
MGGSQGQSGTRYEYMNMSKLMYCQDRFLTVIAEAQVRRNFLSALASDIIQPLTALKVPRARLRQVQSSLTHPKGSAWPYTRASSSRSQGVHCGSHRSCEENSQAQGGILEEMSRTQGGLLAIWRARLCANASLLLCDVLG